VDQQCFRPRSRLVRRSCARHLLFAETPGGRA
jgi:hypothetical protein